MTRNGHIFLILRDFPARITTLFGNAVVFFLTPFENIAGE